MYTRRGQLFSKSKRNFVFFNDANIFSVDVRDFEETRVKQMAFDNTGEHRVCVGFISLLSRRHHD